MTYAINRRQLLQRPDPVDFGAKIREIRAAGYSSAEICFVLNVPRSTLWAWESKSRAPRYEEGRAIIVLAESLRFHVEPANSSTKAALCM